MSRVILFGFLLLGVSSEHQRLSMGCEDQSPPTRLR